MQILEGRNIEKTYKTRFGGNEACALRGISLDVQAGEFIAIMGESGSGKSTLLNILATLDKPTGGQVLIDGKDTASVKSGRAAQFRRDNLGFVFQDFNFLDTFSLKDNILLPLVLSGVSTSEMKERLYPLAQRLGIEELLEKYPYEVSGGQLQRAAVARAVITKPRLLLADEPTGALDSKSSDKLLEIFCELNAGGQTILMVTHSTRAASYASRILFIRDGKLCSELLRGQRSGNDMQNAISEALRCMQEEGEQVV